MQASLARALAQAAMAGLLVALSGCSLLDPYVRASELDESTDTLTLTAAMRLAEAQRKAYYAAVSDRAKLRNGLPLVLVPLGAAAMYKGFSGDGGESTRKLLLKEGLVGASAFGLANHFTSSVREQTYLAGAKALSCSIYATTPYLELDKLGQRLSIQEAEQFARQISSLEASRPVVQNLISDASTETRLRNELLALLAQANAAIAAARQIQTQALETRATLDDAGARLRAVVESIVSEVNLQISQQEPDPATILTMVESLPSVAAKFAPAGRFALPQPPGKELALGVSEQATALKNFEQAVAQLSGKTAEKQVVIDLIAQRAKIAPPLSSCRVQAVQGLIDISPEPPVQMKVGETRQFVIRSTAGIPSVEWTGVVDPKIGLKKTLVGETLLVEVSYSAAVSGVTDVILQAATKSLKKQIVIGLTASEPAPAPPPKSPPAAASAPGEPRKDKPATANPAPTPAPTPSAKPSRPVDTRSDTPSEAAPREKPASAAIATPPPAPAADPAAARNKEEAKALLDKGARLKVLQQKLGIPPSGRFDSETRTAIQRWKKAQGYPDTDDTLQTPVVIGILKG